MEIESNYEVVPGVGKITRTISLVSLQPNQINPLKNSLELSKSMLELSREASQHEQENDPIDYNAIILRMGQLAQDMCSIKDPIEEKLIDDLLEDFKK